VIINAAGQISITAPVATSGVIIDGSKASPPIYDEVSVNFKVFILGKPYDVPIDHVTWDPKANQYTIQATAPAPAVINADAIAAVNAADAEDRAKAESVNAAKEKKNAYRDLAQKTEAAKKAREAADAARISGDKDAPKKEALAVAAEKQQAATAEEAKKNSDAKDAADKKVKTVAAAAKAAEARDVGNGAGLDPVAKKIAEVLNASDELINNKTFPKKFVATLTFTPSQTANGNGVLPQNWPVQNYLVITLSN
jgi:hypothetical protein